MKKILFILLSLAVCIQLDAQSTLKEGMEILRQRYGISYIYDSSLPVYQSCRGKKPDGKGLQGDLCSLFEDSGIEYVIKGRQVILKRKKPASLEEMSILSEVELLDSSIVVDWRMPILTHPEAGALGITRLTVEQAPVLLGEKDVLKTLQMLPGVQAAAEGYSGISVRGGYSDESLILLDGVPIMQPDHFLGLFSIFPAEVVGDATLWKGNFPAKYGGRASGVVDLQSASGNREKWRGGFSVGLLADKFYADGPIGKKLSLQASGRILHTFLAQPVTAKMDQAGNYWFYDINARLDWYVTERDRITFSGYNGYDFFDMHENWYKYEHTYDENYAAYDIRTNQYDKNRYGWGTSMARITWMHSETGRTTLALSNARMKTYSDSRWEYNKDGIHSGKELQFGAATSQTDIMLRTDWSLGIFSFGGEFSRHFLGSDGLSSLQTETDPEGVSTSIPSTVVKPETVPANEAAVYAGASVPIGNRLSVNPGLRLSLFNSMGVTWVRPEPRFYVKWTSGNGWEADAGYSRMVQYFHRIPSGYSSFPTDSWHPVSGSVPPLISNQFSLCGRYEGIPGWEFSAELFYKLQNGVVDYLNSYATLGTSQADWARSVASGKGRGMGMELMARKTSGALTGWLGYTLSGSTRVYPVGSINNGMPFPSSTDRRHRINFCATWAVNEAVDITIAWTFASGSPITLPLRAATVYDETRSEDSVIYIQYASSRNNYRLPPVHRADISVNLRKPMKNGDRVWTFGLYNFYGAQNPDFFQRLSTTDLVIGSDSYYPDMLPGTPFLRTYSYIMFIPTISFTRNFR